MSSHTGFIRLGGIAGVIVTLIGAVINLFLVGADAPGFDAPLNEVASYVEREADRIAAGSALRYAAQFLLIILAVGLHQFVRGSEDGPHRSWALVGALGAVWIAATGSVANASEVVGVWQADALAEQPQFVAAIWGMNVTTFIALLMPWATFILGFSAAGRATGVLPPWIAGLGLLIATAGLISTIGIRSVMAGGFVEPVAIAAYTLTGLWVLATSVLMILRSRRP